MAAFLSSVLLSLIVLSARVSSRTYPPICSVKSCQCTRHHDDDSIAYLSCTYANLTRIPDLSAFPNLTQLNLEGNQIRVLYRSDFNPVRTTLRLIDLSRNGLEKIEDGAFVGMPALTNILLSHNQLEYVGDDLFLNAPTIHVMDLSHNLLSEVPDGVSFVDQYTSVLKLNNNPLGNLLLNAFVGRVYTIRSLDLSYIGMTSLEPIRVGLSEGLSIRELYLDGNFLPALMNSSVLSQLPHTITALSFRHCGIQDIQRGAFSSLIFLNSLYLQGNNLSTLQGGAFQGLHLTTLNLDNCNISDIKSSAFEGLRTQNLYLAYNNLSVISQISGEAQNERAWIDYIDLTGSNITRFRGTPFNRFVSLRTLVLRDNFITNEALSLALRSHSTLESLDLSGNLLHSVPNLPTTMFPNLADLSVSQNSIQFLSRENLAGMTNLEMLHIDENPLQGFSDNDDTFADCQRLRILSFDHTRITQLPNLTYIPQLQAFRANHARIARLSASGICSHSSRLKILELQSNLLTEIPPLQCEHVIDLDLSHNFLTTVPADLIQGMNKLRVINVGENQISELSNDFFKSSSQLELVQLGGNNLEALPEMSSLKFLIFLNASHNQLSRIPKDAFREQSSLELLYLNDNSIGYIDPEAFPVSNIIRTLSLSQNSPLAEWKLPDQGFQNLTKLYLEGNPHLLRVPRPAEIPLASELHFTYNYHCCSWEGSVAVDSANTGTVTDIATVTHQSVTLPTHLPLVPLPPSTTDRCDLSDDVIGLITRLQEASSVYSISIDPQTCQIRVTIRDGIAVDEMSDDVGNEHNENLDDVIQSTLADFRQPPSATVVCTPASTQQSRCQNLLDSSALRVTVWIIWIIAVIANGLLLIGGVILKRKIRFNDLPWCAFLISNVAMAVYLAIVASTDLQTKSEFHLSALEWQFGSGCKVSGFLAVFSTMFFLHFLVILTLEQLHATSKSYIMNKSRKYFTLGLYSVGVILAILFAGLPLVGVSSYDKTPMCLPSVTDFQDKFYVGFTLTTILLAFVFIFFSFSYIIFQLAIRRNSDSGNRREERKELLVRFAKAAVVSIITFLCWVPLIIVGYAAISNISLVKATEVQYFIFLIFPLPICINPFALILILCLSPKKASTVDGEPSHSISMSQQRESCRSCDKGGDSEVKRATTGDEISEDLKEDIKLSDHE